MSDMDYMAVERSECELCAFNYCCEEQCFEDDEDEPELDSDFCDEGGHFNMEAALEAHGI